MAYGHVVKPGTKVNLKNVDPDEDGGLSKAEGKDRLADMTPRLAELQELLFAAGQHSLLIVFQGSDTSGKDGSIRRLLEAVNVQSTHVSSFKVPTAGELAHDFLWRIHQQTPAKGEIGIFNRSHYEDVLVVRVHNLVPKEVWKARYDQINEFESVLTSASTIIVKFYLHISREEQQERLQDREKDPTKSWKLSIGDWKERERWADYIEAFEEALERCSTKNAPWTIVPANHKWYRDLVVFETIINALAPYESQWRKHLEEIGQERRAEIDAFRNAEPNR